MTHTLTDHARKRLLALRATILQHYWDADTDTTREYIISCLPTLCDLLGQYPDAPANVLAVVDDWHDRHAPESIAEGDYPPNHGW